MAEEDVGDGSDSAFSVDSPAGRARACGDRGLLPRSPERGLPRRCECAKGPIRIPNSHLRRQHRPYRYVRRDNYSSPSENSSRLPSAARSLRLSRYVLANLARIEPASAHTAGCSQQHQLKWATEKNHPFAGLSRS